jgi:hypothetical protein
MVDGQITEEDMAAKGSKEEMVVVETEPINRARLENPKSNSKNDSCLLINPRQQQ